MENALNYNRIAESIEFIQLNFKNNLKLEEIAAHVNMSPFHFQRLFTEWAGVSPKKFSQFLSIQYAKNLISSDQKSLFDITYESGLSSTSRLHDLFIRIEGMTPGEFKNGAGNTRINYHYSESLFGSILIASTPLGICYLAFYSDKKIAFELLKNKFPFAQLNEKTDAQQTLALTILNNPTANLNEIKLHLQGTPFQLKVWEALLQIPSGKLSTYQKIAKSIDKPKASRAIGTAIGNNPIAFLIPCHRVIRSTGELGGYMWGVTRKSAIIGWEAAQLNQEE